MRGEGGSISLCPLFSSSSSPLFEIVVLFDGMEAMIVCVCGMCCG